MKKLDDSINIVADTDPDDRQEILLSSQIEESDPR